MEKYRTRVLEGKHKSSKKAGWIKYSFRAESDNVALQMANGRFPSYEWRMERPDLIQRQEEEDGTRRGYDHEAAGAGEPSEVPEPDAGA